MRYRLLTRGGYTINSISIIGGETSGAVYLSRDPVGEMEAATKRYVDNKVSNLDASSFSEGKLPVAVLPAFTGDITKDEKSNYITLTPTGVAPGTYTKVSVNAKGQVVGGGSLVESDIPAIPFSKVSSGRPTTLAGYGILDALPKSGGTLTGKLTAATMGNDPYSVVNKQYVDALIATETSGVMVGGIVYKPTSVQQENFLRCNGGLLDRSVYPKLFSVIGERFSFFLHPGNGQPWSSQHYINSADETGFGTWALNSVLPIALTGHRVLVTKNRIFVIGGRTNNTVRNTVYSAAIDQYGSLGAWSNVGTLPRVRFDGSLFVTKNRVYYVGGKESVTGNPVNTVYTATITDTGTLSSWTTGSTLSAAITNGAAITTRDRVLYIGGSSSTGAVSTILSSSLTTAGVTSTWPHLTTIPSALTGAKAAIINDHCVIFGGNNGTAASDAIYRSAIIGVNGQPSNFVSAGNLPVAIEDFNLVVTKNKVYLLGKHDALNNTNTEIIGTINPDGTIGNWSYGQTLPATVGGSEVAIIGNKAYMIGGLTASNTSSNDIYVANFSGGKNDYSNEYGSLYNSTLVDRTKFQLPDITPSVDEIFAYIKYT